MIFCFLTFSYDFVTQNSNYWTHPFGDPITNMIGLEYFIKEDWSFPIFNIKSMAYPNGANLFYTDSIPMLGIFAKLLFHFTGIKFSYFGIWICSSFIILAISIAQLANKLYLPLIATAFAVIISIFNPALLVRYGHSALLAHFIIIFALIFYFSYRNRPISLSVFFNLFFILLISILIQSYFLLMVYPIIFATFLQLWKKNFITIKTVFLIFLFSLLTIFIIAFCSGIILNGEKISKAWGFGVYSMNALSPFLPSAKYLPNFLVEIVNWDGNRLTWDQTSGQYEGYNYLGIGLIFSIVMSLRGYKIYFELIKNNIFLFFSFCLLLIYALSNNIYIGSLTFDINFLYKPFSFLTDIFRVPGRYFWPIYYVILFASVIVIFKTYTNKIAIFILVSASLFQILENNYLREGLVNAGYNKYPQLLDEKKVSALLEKKNLFLQYPSFQCGGLFSKWPENNLNMELLFIVAKKHIPTNSAYLARSNIDCEKERNNLSLMKFFDGSTLYLFNNEYYALVDISNKANKCHKVSYGYYCSN